MRKELRAYKNRNRGHLGEPLQKSKEGNGPLDRRGLVALWREVIEFKIHLKDRIAHTPHLGDEGAFSVVTDG